MKSQWVCINEDGCSTGIVDADNESDALIACIQLWAGQASDMHHVHEWNKKDDSECLHCQKIYEEFVKQPKH